MSLGVDVVDMSNADSGWQFGVVDASPRIMEACLRGFGWYSIRCSYLSQVLAAEAVAGEHVRVGLDHDRPLRAAG